MPPRNSSTTVRHVYVCVFFIITFTFHLDLLGPQSRFGNKLLEI